MYYANDGLHKYSSRTNSVSGVPWESISVVSFFSQWFFCPTFLSLLLFLKKYINSGIPIYGCCNIPELSLKCIWETCCYGYAANNFSNPVTFIISVSLQSTFVVPTLLLYTFFSLYLSTLRFWVYSFAKKEKKKHNKSKNDFNSYRYLFFLDFL